MSSGSISWLQGVEDRRVAIVVAHQDDESIAFCSVVSRCPNALIVHVTDGAPPEPGEWKGCNNRAAYAALREDELEIALDAAGHTGERIALRIRDSRVLDNVQAVIGRLDELFNHNGTRVVFTHAYEGGHPDHDAVAYSVAAAAQRRGDVWAIEAPFYRSQGGKPVWQTFTPNAVIRIENILLSTEEKQLKQRMLAAHKSQGEACGNVNEGAETFRMAPAYDFTQPPNAGALSRNYQRLNIDGTRLAECLRTAHVR